MSLEPDFQQIVDNLFQQRWSVTTNLFSTEIVADLRAEILAAAAANELHAARIGSQQQIHTNIRNDLIKWVDIAQPSHALKTYLDFLEQCRIAFNRELQLGIKEFEVHYTLYHHGSFYQRHVDQFKANTNRVVSFIFYLNEQWQTSDGGELKLYDANNKLLTTVLPEANTFACFLSDLPHEVLPTKKQRLSLTGWFKKF